MNTWNLRRPVWVRFLVRLPIIVFTAGLSLFLLYLSYFLIVNVSFRSWTSIVSFLMVLVSIPFSVLFFLIACWLTVDSFIQYVFSSEGIWKKRFGKRIRCLPWEEIVETGAALIPNSRGLDTLLYFSVRNLEIRERKDIYDCRKDHGVIMVSFTEIQHYEELAAVCPLPLPEAKTYKKVAHWGIQSHPDLVTFRRSRLPDGSWEEADPDILFYEELFGP